MAGKIKINTERCKGCGLCITVCPKNCIVVSGQSNKKGYFPAEAINGQCTGCANCALICPDAVIEVYRDSNIKPAKPAGTGKADKAKEKV
ncbi:MAG: ferredoxin family protein [Candidatus Brocadiia bacterium]|nr:MAG: ferredoxin family protein [Candidatus Brocadiia bacterium]